MAGKKELFYAPKDFSNGFHASLAQKWIEIFFELSFLFLGKGESEVEY